MTAPTEPEIRGALRIVGAAARRLGVKRRPLHPGGGFDPGDNDPTMWYLLPRDPRPTPDLMWITTAEAFGWSALAEWIEGGQPPIVPIGTTGTPRGWAVQLGDRHVTVLSWSREDSAAIATLARALLVLRRWSHRVEAWGLRDSVAEALDRIAREASVMAEGGPKPWTPIEDPIPAWYLQAFGTAPE